MFFYTYAPDDVHDMRVIRLATPYTDQHSFPAVVPDKYKKALAGATDTERVVRSEDGSIEFDLRERALQSLAARNPCACAVVYWFSITSRKTFEITFSGNHGIA
jgi:hypothetical protein